MLSRWEPTPDELALLNAGGAVELMVIGAVHPPVSIIAVAAPVEEQGLAA
jgi:hypothetical protein